VYHENDILRARSNLSLSLCLIRYVFFAQEPLQQMFDLLLSSIISIGINLYHLSRKLKESFTVFMVSF